jgi:hypothetical protein
MNKIIFILLFITVLTDIKSQDLKAKLEASYEAFAEAVKAKDVTKLKSSLSTFAYKSIKNQMLSSGAKFPDDFFAMAPRMLEDIGKLQYRRAVANGPTAYCIYSGKDKYGEINIYILKFLEENASWKFNMAEEDGSEAITKSVKENNFAFLETDKKYKPDGILPVIPAEIVPGDYKAMLDIMCYGYEVQATVNGNAQNLVKGGSSSGVIMGGIKKGANKIVLTVKPIKAEKQSTLTVGVRALIKEEEKDVFKLEEKTPEATIIKEFIVE